MPETGHSAPELLRGLLDIYNDTGSSVGLLEALRALWEQYHWLPVANDEKGWEVYEKYGPDGFRHWMAKLQGK